MPSELFFVMNLHEWTPLTDIIRPVTRPLLLTADRSHHQQRKQLETGVLTLRLGVPSFGAEKATS